MCAMASAHAAEETFWSIMSSKAAVKDAKRLHHANAISKAECLANNFSTLYGPCE